MITINKKWHLRVHTSRIKNVMTASKGHACAHRRPESFHRTLPSRGNCSQSMYILVIQAAVVVSIVTIALKVSIYPIWLCPFKLPAHPGMLKPHTNKVRSWNIELKSQKSKCQGLYPYKILQNWGTPPKNTKFDTKDHTIKLRSPQSHGLHPPGRDVCGRGSLRCAQERPIWRGEDNEEGWGVCQVSGLTLTFANKC